jgi:hypothetical protein
MSTEDAEMLADVKAYDAARARLENGEDELIPFEIVERRHKERSRSASGVTTPENAWAPEPTHSRKSLMDGAPGSNHFFSPAAGCDQFGDS